MRIVAFACGLLVTVTGCAALTGMEPPAPSVTPPITTGLAVPPTTTTTVPPTTTTTATRIVDVLGRVVDPDGMPVPGAHVAIADMATTTGRYGYFQLQTAGPGRLRVSRPGWTSEELDWADDNRFTRITMRQKVIRGLRVAADAAAHDPVFDGLLSIAEDTAVNALVFDTKQEGGTVLYDTTVAEAHEIGAVEVHYDPVRRLEQTRAAGLYAITRIVVFEDVFRSRARPEESLVGGWVDPRAGKAWDYNIALAAEACRLGFDEIQFDYVRFPAGRTAAVSGQLELSQEERVAVIEGFLAEAREVLSPLGCAVGADVFGIVVSVADDQGLGQRPEELSRQVHVLSPMVYPSHYSAGWLGFTDPNDYPYQVTSDAIADALPRVEPGTVLRPWLQAFFWSDDEVRTAIQAAEDLGVGWMLWNVRSNFDRAAIPTDAELGS